MAQNVIVRGAPGFQDEFEAELVPGMGHVPAVDGRGDLAVVLVQHLLGDKDPLVVPAECIVYPEGE